MIPLDVMVTVEPTLAGGGVSDKVMTDAPVYRKNTRILFCSAYKTRNAKIF